MSRKRRHEEIAIPNVKIEDLKPGGGGRGRTKWGGPRSSRLRRNAARPLRGGQSPFHTLRGSVALPENGPAGTVPVTFLIVHVVLYDI